MPQSEMKNLDKITDLTAEAVEAFTEYAKTNLKINLEVINILNEQQNPGYISYIMASHLTREVEGKQSLLEEVDIQKRIEQLIKIIND